MAKVGKEELLRTLRSLQKDKSPRSDGLPIEFFLSGYNFLEEDHRIVEA